ncbi:MAG: hypothetical protein OK442_01640 [Thaumarchaeota archaeon]|nr:hypothetical protein [Nitrososphaerota archaeon]
MKATILNSRLVLLIYFLLPIVTYFDVTSRQVPPAVFYGYWFLASGVLGLLVTVRVVGASETSAYALTALFCMILSASIITPLGVPSNVLDNYPSTPTTVQLTQSTLTHGRLPNGGDVLSYINYPSAIFTLASISALTGLTLTTLAKALGVLLSVVPMFAFYSLIRNRIVALLASAIAALSPWIFTTLTHYTPAALASVLLCFNVAMLFRFLDDRAIGNLAVMTILSVALMFSDPLMSFLWIVFLIGFLAVKLLLGSKGDNRQVSAVAMLVAISIGLWSAWYALLSGSNAMLQDLTQVANQVLSGSRKLTTTAIQSTGTKPSLLTGVEYLAFLALIIFSLSVPLYYRRRNTSYSAMVAGSLLAAAATVLPWIEGFTQATDLVSRSSFIYQIGVACVIAVLLFEQLKTPRLWKVLACVVLVSLAASNALLYGLDPGRYNPSSPMLTDDSRMNLEAWHYFGATFCQLAMVNAVWGVRIGFPFTTCLSGYYYLVTGTSTNGVVVPASDLSDLQRSKVGPGQLVIMRESIALVPEWPQGLPAPPDVIFQNYDVVFRSGDAVLIYT